MAIAIRERTDDHVRDAVLFQLRWEREVNPAGIGVAVDQGVVTLTGWVDSYAQKIAAEKAAARVHGVRGIANDIVVKLKDQRTDPDIAHDAVCLLRSSDSVPADVKVTVRDGFVTLEGHVDWMSQKLAAENAIKYLNGVRGLINHITLRAHVSATEVKARIEQALGRQGGGHVRRVSVHVAGEKVTLTGCVGTWGEREQAGRAAWSAPGVTTVENRIAVTPSAS